MYEPGQPVDRQIAALHEQADEAMRGLQKTIEGVRAAQQEALRATGEATSQDGSVRVTVDATGVLTGVTFAPSAFDRSTPEKLGQTVVATAQAAAAQARGRMTDAMAGVRDDGDVRAAAAGATELGVPRLSTPEVPRTAVDPTAQDGWTAGPQSEPVAEPRPDPAPSRPQRRPDTDENDSEFWLSNERPW